MKPVVFSLAGILLLTSCSSVDKEEAAQKQAGEPKKMAELKTMSQQDKPLKDIIEVPKGDTRYVGMELKAAMELAKSEGRPARVIQEDGEHRIVTRDYRPERLNFVVVKGKVTEVTRG